MASSYLAKALAQPAVIANRDEMIGHYLKDVRRDWLRWRAYVPPRPEQAVRLAT